MKIYKLLLLLLIVLSCQKKEKANEDEKSKIDHKETYQVEPSLEETSINILTESKKSIVRYIKNEWLKDSSAYEPISWGVLDTIDALEFKYKISHKYKSPGKSYTKKGIRDTILIVDNTFTLDSNFRISSIVGTKEYDQHYNNKGVPYQMYSNRELQKIGITNNFDMVHFKNGKNKLVLIGGYYELSTSIGITKKEWIKKNVRGGQENLLKETDTIEYCTDLIGEECFQYIFAEEKLKEIKNIL